MFFLVVVAVAMDTHLQPGLVIGAPARLPLGREARKMLVENKRVRDTKPEKEGQLIER